MELYIFLNEYKSYLRYTILLTKTTTARNDVALSYHRVRGLYFRAVVFVATICTYTVKDYPTIEVTTCVTGFCHCIYMHIIATVYMPSTQIDGGAGIAQ